MLAAGEDPRFIARRLVILASEDIGHRGRRARSCSPRRAAPCRGVRRGSPRRS
ncbi:MAG: hypothetical protein U5R31_10255 [Acidimicrobiia bacterium]|nr:hypothetical protein [Acidimicrobiia bacterium]